METPTQDEENIHKEQNEPNPLFGLSNMQFLKEKLLYGILEKAYCASARTNTVIITLFTICTLVVFALVNSGKTNWAGERLQRVVDIKKWHYQMDLHNALKDKLYKIWENRDDNFCVSTIDWKITKKPVIKPIGFSSLNFTIKLLYYYNKTIAVQMEPNLLKQTELNIDTERIEYIKGRQMFIDYLVPDIDKAQMVIDTIHIKPVTLDAIISSYHQKNPTDIPSQKIINDTLFNRIFSTAIDTILLNNYLENSTKQDKSSILNEFAIALDYYKTAPYNPEAYHSLIEHLRQKRNEITSLNVALLGINIDVNDLCVLGSCTAFIMMLIFIYILSREYYNLKYIVEPNTEKLEIEIRKQSLDFISGANFAFSINKSEFLKGIEFFIWLFFFSAPVIMFVFIAKWDWETWDLGYITSHNLELRLLFIYTIGFILIFATYYWVIYKIISIHKWWENQYKKIQLNNTPIKYKSPLLLSLSIIFCSVLICYIFITGGNKPDQIMWKELTSQWHEMLFNRETLSVLIALVFIVIWIMPWKTLRGR